MTTTTQTPATDRQSPSLPLSIRIAWRELRGGLNGFYIFLFCVALGVTAIAAIGSLSETMKKGLSSEGQTILGGDMELALQHRRATEKERSFLKSKGRISEIASVRAMAQAKETGKTTLVALKAVDKAFPLFGAAELTSGNDLQSTLGNKNTVVVDPLLLKRLKVETGDEIKLGTGVVKIADTIKTDPDRLSAPPNLGPNIMMSVDTLKQTGLAQPGSLARWAYRLQLPETAPGKQALANIREEIKTDYRQSGFSIRDRNDPAPVIRRAITQMAQFLTLVGLTALVVGGVGVANGASAYLNRKRKVIAAFKCLGASSHLITRIYLIQVAIVALIGIAIGLFLGAVLPGAIAPLMSAFLPFDQTALLHPKALLLAATYGLLVALLFVIWPLGRARRVKPQTLMRENISDERGHPPFSFVIAGALTAAALIAVTILASENMIVATAFCVALFFLFGVFIGLGYALQWIFRSFPRPQNPELAIALNNLGAPGSLTRSITLSLGTGLSLLVAVALIDRSMVAELQTGLPRNAPNYFFLDIGKQQIGDFEKFIKQATPDGKLNQAPMLRGRIVSLAGQTAENIKASPNVAWALRGDRGLTYAETLPEGSKITEGEWWPKDYAGEPLVSFEKELGEGFGLKVGDTVTVNVLGRNVTAKIANFRELKWESLSINFVMIFSPNTLSGAPFNMLATLHTKEDPETAAREQGDETATSFVSSLTEKFPNITVIRVRDTIEAVNEIFSKLMLAIRAAGGLTLIAGSFVLAGALATAHSSRIYQSVILKTLGATRRRIITSHLIEYALLGAATAIFACLLGALAAWVTITQLMELKFTLDPWAIIQAIGIAVALVVIFGTAGSWRALSAKISPKLRSTG